MIEKSNNAVVEDILANFESQWTPESKPSDLLLFVPMGDEVATDVFVELANTDMELRFSAGQSVRVESYLELLNSDDQYENWIAELIFNEFQFRLRHDDATADLIQYKDRFPSLFDQVLAKVGSAFESTKPSKNSKSDFGSRFERRMPFRSGGLGKIWLAYDHELERDVAIKEIREDFKNLPIVLARFQRESQITSRLDHPGILPVYSIGNNCEGRPYYAMKFVQGQTFSEVIDRFYKQDRSLLGFNRLLRQFIEICNTVEYVHRKGVIHRDLKPQNVMVGEHGQTIVIDWGLAKVTSTDFWVESNRKVESVASQTTIVNGQAFPENVESGSASSPEITLSGSKIGTPGYMSPEQEKGNHDDVDNRTDVFSLGRILDRVLSGPVGEHKLYHPPSKIVLDSIVARAAAKLREDRYDSAAEIAEEVEKYLVNEKTIAHRESALESLVRKSRKHQKWLIPALFAALLVAMTTLIAMSVVRGYRDSNIQLSNNAKEADDQRGSMLGLMQWVFEDPQVVYRPLGVALESKIPEMIQRIEDVGDPVDRARLYDAIGRTRLVVGKYDQALKLTLDAKKLIDDNSGSNFPLQIENVIQLARIYREAEYLQDALKWAKLGKKWSVENLGYKSQQYVDSLAELVTISRQMDLHDESRAYGQELVSFVNSVENLVPRDKVRQLNSRVAMLLSNRHQYGEAEKLQREIEDYISQHEPFDEWVRSVSKYNRAMLHERSRDYDLAIELLEDVLTSRIKEVSADHPDVWKVIRAISNNLVWLENRSLKPRIGKNDNVLFDAVAAMNERIEKYRIWGPDTAATYLWSLGLAYAEFNRIKKTDVKPEEKTYQKSVEILDNAIQQYRASELASDGKLLLELLTWRARYLKYDVTGYEKSLTAFQQTNDWYLKLCQKENRELHFPGYFELLKQMSIALATAKQYDQALAVANDACRIGCRMYGEAHDNIRTIRAFVQRLESRIPNLKVPAEAKTIKPSR